jgi:hypothetical protein
VFRGVGLQAPVTGSIPKSRDQPDRALLLVSAAQPAHLARRESEPRGNRDLLELSVDKSLNALEPMRISRKEGQRFTACRSMVSRHVGPLLMKQDMVNFLSETSIRQ